MLDAIIDFVSGLGIWGLFTSAAVEASSLPFPGGLITLIFGYLLDMTFLQLVAVGVAASVVYTIFSLIPYAIGYLMEEKLKKLTSRKGIEKAQKGFQKFGVWSVAISRPLGIGNYISYAAGLSRMNILSFLLLTMLGILPWMLGMLWLGSIGNLDSVSKFIEEVQLYGIIVLLAGGAGYWVYHKKVKSRSKNLKENH